MAATTSQDRHPRAEELLAYAEGELPDIFVAALEQHLLRCADCRALVQDFRSFPSLAAGTSDLPTAAEKEADWQAIRARLKPTPTPLAPPTEERSTPATPLPTGKTLNFPSPRPIFRWRSLAGWVAATLLAGVLVYREGEARKLNQQIHSLQNAVRTDLKVQSLGLDPLRGIEQVPTGAEGCVLVAALPPGDRSFVAEISGPSFKLTVPARKSRDSNFIFSLPGGSIGPHRLTLTFDDGEILTFDFVVTPE